MRKDLTLLVRTRKISFRQNGTVVMTRLDGAQDFLGEIDPVTDFGKECSEQLRVSHGILGYPDKMMTPIPCRRMAVFAEALQAPPLTRRRRWMRGRKALTQSH